MAIAYSFGKCHSCHQGLHLRDKIQAGKVIGSEHYCPDCENAEPRWRIASMNRLEMRELIKWVMDHVNICSHQGEMQIKQSGSSGIGTNTRVCCGCGAERDVTDYGSW